MSAGIPSWAVPGAKVVCVELGGQPVERLPGWPAASPAMLGCVYTIAHTDWVIWEGKKFGICWLVERSPDTAYAITLFRPVVDDDTEAKLFREKRAPSRAARKRRQVASPAGTGEGGGKTQDPVAAAALAAISVFAGEFLPSGTLAARFCSVGAGRAAPLSAVPGRQGGGRFGSHVEHGLHQSFSGFGAVGNPAAAPETPSPCRTITPASSATCAAVLPEAYCAGGEACAR